MKKIMSRIFLDKWGNWRGEWVFTAWAIAFILGAIILCGIFLSPVWVANSIGCHRLADMDQSHTYDYSVWTGCRVLSNDGYWIPVDNLQYNNVSLEEVPK